MDKHELMERANTIIKHSASEGYEYCIKANEWQKGDKHRTYFCIVEMRNGKSYREKQYGYLDNVSGEYIPAKYGDLTKNYDFGGSGFAE